jgi:hypothetical protein
VIRRPTRPVRTIGEVSLLGTVCELFHINFFLNLVGLNLVPVHKKMDRQVIWHPHPPSLAIR